MQVFSLFFAFFHPFYLVNSKKDVILRSKKHKYRDHTPDFFRNIGSRVLKFKAEIKSAERIENKHKKGLNAFAEEHPDCRLILVSLDPITRKSANIELIYILDFLKLLWNGEIF